MPSSRRPYSARERRLARRLSRTEYRNSCLRRENASLRRQLASCRAQDGASAHLRDAAPLPAVLLAERSDMADRLSLRSFPRYCLTLLRGSYLMFLWRRWLRLFRRLKLVRTIITITSAVLASAVLLTMAAAVLPFLAVGLALSVMGIFLTARHSSRRMTLLLRGRRVVVLAAQAGTRWEDNPFLLRLARETAASPGCAVIILSPYHLLNAGPLGRRPYLTVRREAEGLYLVRPLYWFSLRRHLLRDGRVRLIFIC